MFNCPISFHLRNALELGAISFFLLDGFQLMAMSVGYKFL